MHRRVLSLFAVSVLAAGHASAAQLSAPTLTQALAVPVGERVALPMPETPAALIASTVLMKRVDPLAPGAKTYVADADGLHEIAEPDWRYFVADASEPGAPRYVLALSADGTEANGMIFGMGGRFSVHGSRKGDALSLVATPRPKSDEHGNPIYFACDQDVRENLASSIGLPTADAVQSALDAAGVAKSATAATRSATVAIDTDTELLADKFAGNTTSATNYLNQLFVGMNTIYERDLDVTLLRGTTILRTASDPYTTTSTNPTATQLNEFGNEWQANQSSVSRAFAAQISGKSSSVWSSAGIAWVIGASNMCTQKSGNGGHYSVSRVFKFPGSVAADDVMVVAHEIGHNFGVSHTHCTDITTGNDPVSTNTIDRCYNGEAGNGCYSGTATCPTAQTINGMTNVTGTLMSYCHITPAGCDTFEVFHPRNATTLTAIATQNVTSGCFTTGAVGSFSIAAASLTEGNSGTQTLNFVVTRTGGSGSASVTAATSDGTATTADGDYVAKSQTLTFAAAGTQNFSVTINGDTRDENNETFAVTLSSPTNGFLLGSPAQVNGTITNNDAAPAISINSPAAVSEGSAITFTATLNAASGKTVTVNYATASGSSGNPATQSSDFASASGTLTFNPGVTTQTFNVSTTNDVIDEPDTETFTATLSTPNNASLGTSVGTGSINDNDALPSVSVADASATEAGNLVFTVTLSAISGRNVVVPYSTADGTATAGSDYLQTAASLTINAGLGAGQIVVNTSHDTVDEPDETLTLTVAAPTNATVGDGSATGTIIDDDLTPAVVSIGDATLAEGNSGTTAMIFTLTIPSVAAQATQIGWATSPIDATAGSDYTTSTGTATIAQGSTSTTVQVPIVGDSVDEFDEQFVVNLSATASGSVGDGQGVGTILDDDSGGDPVFRNGFD